MLESGPGIFPDCISRGQFFIDARKRERQSLQIGAILCVSARLPSRDSYAFANRTSLLNFRSSVA
jgi:hypothetical protein